MIGSFAGDEDNYLVKIMIMPLKLPICTVIDMKQPEIILEIDEKVGIVRSGILFFLSDRTVLIITYLPPISAMII